MIFASFQATAGSALTSHQGKEERIQPFPFLSMNRTTCMSRLEAAPTDIGMSLRAEPGNIVFFF
jgi:hypothetical protein